MHKATLKALERRRQKQEEQEERNRIQAGVEAQRRRTDPQYLTLLGEKSPGVDADNLHDALVVALRFAKAYTLDKPVIVGETSLLDLERRIYYEAQRIRLARLCPDGSLSELRTPDGVGLAPFDDVWVPLVGAELPITAEQYDAARQEMSER